MILFPYRPSSVFVIKEILLKAGLQRDEEDKRCLFCPRDHETAFYFIAECLMYDIRCCYINVIVLGHCIADLVLRDHNGVISFTKTALSLRNRLLRHTLPKV